MSTEGYMTEEEFKQAIDRAIDEICANVYGPIDYSKLRGNLILITAPPQSYRGVALKTYDDICRHIGSIYVNGTSRPWYPCMGIETDYGKYGRGVITNFPQYLDHFTGKMEFKTMKEITVRNLGCRVFSVRGGDAYLPDWLRGMLTFYKSKYTKIMASMPDYPKQSDIDAALEWHEPSPVAAKILGPTDNSFVDLWRMMTKKRLDDYKASQEKMMADIRVQLDALSAEIIAVLEKIPFKPKYGELTNCADVPIATIPE